MTGVEFYFELTKRLKGELVLEDDGNSNVLQK